ncbi:hypothetical protein CsSME_00005806 [Camellia sinensis var. sinensis]
MATSGSKAATGDLVVDSLISSCGNVLNFVQPTGVYFSDRRLHNCQKAGIGFKSQETINRCSIYGCHKFDITRRSGNSNSLVGPWFRSLHTSSSQCYSDDAVPNVSFDGLACDEQLANSAAPAERYMLLSCGCFISFSYYYFYKFFYGSISHDWYLLLHYHSLSNSNFNIF